MNDSPARQRKEKVCVLIDSCGLNAAAKQHNCKIDYKRLKDWIARQRDIPLLRYYSCESSDAVASRGDFYSVLKRAGYELHLHQHGQLEEDECESLVLCHAEIVFDMCELIISSHFDTMSLVTGSGNFVNIVTRVRKRGVDVEVVFFDDHCDSLLKTKANQFRPLSIEAVILRK